MLTITNGHDTLMVTKGAYAALYKHQGYTVVSGAGYNTPAPNTDSEASDSVAEIAAEDDEDSAVVVPDEEDNRDSCPEETTDSYTEDDEGGEEGGDGPELSEIPLIEMTKSQLCKYADQLGVEYTGEETKKQLRGLIKEALT